jgi:hypothetical protein
MQGQRYQSDRTVPSRIKCKSNVPIFAKIHSESMEITLFSCWHRKLALAAFCPCRSTRLGNRSISHRLIGHRSCQGAPLNCSGSTNRPLRFTPDYVMISASLKTWQLQIQLVLLRTLETIRALCLVSTIENLNMF